jgi:hypothetical protein
MRTKNEPFLLSFSGVFAAPFTGAFRLPFLPDFVLYDALPFAFNPPFGFWPALRVHAGDFAIMLLALQMQNLLASLDAAP